MDNDNKMLVMAALVIVALGFIGFIFGDLTGFAARSSREKVLTRLYLSSDSNIIDEFNPVVGPTDFLYITVETGSAGIKDEVAFYEQLGLNPRKRAKAFMDCTGYICRPNRVETKNYKIPSNWDGDYCAKVYDNEFKEDVEACFTVE